jgi:hypothetical protein
MRQPRSCNRAATELHQSCNKGGGVSPSSEPPRTDLWSSWTSSGQFTRQFRSCNRAATELCCSSVATELQQSSVAELQQSSVAALLQLLGAHGPRQVSLLGSLLALLVQQYRYLTLELLGLFRRMDTVEASVGLAADFRASAATEARTEARTPEIWRFKVVVYVSSYYWRYMCPHRTSYIFVRMLLLRREFPKSGDSRLYICVIILLALYVSSYY